MEGNTSAEQTDDGEPCCSLATLGGAPGKFRNLKCISVVVVVRLGKCNLFCCYVHFVVSHGPLTAD